MSHREQILKFLTPPGRTLTSWQAIQKWRCTRLSARVDEINKSKTHHIHSELIWDKKNKVHYSKYSLR